MNSINKNKSILVIEDNKDMQEMYKIFFSDKKEEYKINM